MSLRPNRLGFTPNEGERAFTKLIAGELERVERRDVVGTEVIRRENVRSLPSRVLDAEHQRLGRHPEWQSANGDDEGVESIAHALHPERWRHGVKESGMS